MKFGKDLFWRRQQVSNVRRQEILWTSNFSPSFLLHNINDVFCLQWIVEESSAPISHAIFSCDSQLIYASFLDGFVRVFGTSNLQLRCQINPTAYLPFDVRYVVILCLSLYQDAWPMPHAVRYTYYQLCLVTNWHPLFKFKLILIMDEFLARRSYMHCCKYLKNSCHNFYLSMHTM